jgi:hypothetical protein
VLGGNFLTMLKQAASLPIGMDMLENKASSMSEAVVMWGQNPREMTRKINGLSEFMAGRRDSFQREFQEAAEKRFLERILGTYSLKDKTQKYLDNFKEFTMEGIKATDSVTVNLLWYAKYTEALNKYGNTDRAVKEADYLIRKTQPVGGVLNLPTSFTGNALERMYTMFLNQPNQNLQRFHEMVVKWGEEDTSKNLSKAFWRIALPTAILYMVTNAFQLPWRDPEGFTKEAIRQGIGGIPILGQLGLAASDFLLGTIRRARGGKWRKDRFLTDFSPSGMGVMEDIADLMQDPTAEKALTTTAAAKGLPVVAYRRAKKAIKEGRPELAVYSEQALEKKAIRASNAELKSIKTGLLSKDQAKRTAASKRYKKLTKEEKIIVREMQK